jgi:UDP-hydrolysing UDP-N-acetyl-D-glucosamine 2-epimerase
MGELPGNVHNVGCPAIDYMKEQEYIPADRMNQEYPYNEFKTDFSGDYIVAIQHPVTTECDKAYAQMMVTLEALQETKIDTFLIYPNPDAGSAAIVRAIRHFQTKYGSNSVIKDKIKNISFKHYLNVLKHSKAIVGNSSSGIREAHLFNIPAINIGSRQFGRERTPNVIDVPHNKSDIKREILKATTCRVKSPNLYGNGTAGTQIAEWINRTDLKLLVSKKFNDA